jgi:hypothetical protein
MAKIQVTLDASKLRNLVTKRSYKNQEGTDVSVDEVKFELVELKEPKQIFAKDTMRIMKTHFACVVQTKEEREAKADTIYVGEGFTTLWDDKVSQSQAPKKASAPSAVENLPF